MSKDKVISELKLSINELDQLILSSNMKGDKTSSTQKKKANLLSSIVDSFYFILSAVFLSGEKYWHFVSRHVNRPVTRFCKMYEKNDLAEEEKLIEEYEKKGKYWILFSILEKSFSDSMMDIIELLENNENFESKNLDIYKKDILIILDELNSLKLDNINNEDYQSYLIFIQDKPNNLPKDGASFLSPIFNDDKDKIEFYEERNESVYFDIQELNPIDKKFEELDSLKKDEEKEKNPELFEFKKFADIGPNIVDNFYNFIPKGETQIPFDEDKNSNIIINQIDEEGKIEDLRKNSGLILNIDIAHRNLPSDDLYQISQKNYAKNDELIYRKKKKKIVNSHLLYINQFYKKANYHKFYLSGTYDKSITIKQQNYQCFICLKRFSTVLGLPLEHIFWCSYYMRFVCKDCISNDFSIIPQLILKDWCFEKCSVSKRAKEFIMSWFDKPIIYIKKKDILLKYINKDVFRIKKEINRIFDYMKCDDPSGFIDTNIPEYKYLFLKEKIFSLKDLMEIHNKKFITKLKGIKNVLIEHIRNGCNLCKYEGEICSICENEERINFYDSEEVYYCKVCHNSFHKKCWNNGEGDHHSQIM